MRKAFQKHLLSFLAKKWAIPFVLVLVILAFNSLLWFLRYVPLSPYHNYNLLGIWILFYPLVGVTWAELSLRQVYDALDDSFIDDFCAVCESVFVLSPSTNTADWIYFYVG